MLLTQTQIEHGLVQVIDHNREFLVRVVHTPKEDRRLGIVIPTWHLLVSDILVLVHLIEVDARFLHRYHGQICHLVLLGVLGVE